MKTVYILGAGFSSSAGAPLGRDLLNSIIDLATEPKRWGEPRRFDEKRNAYLSMLVVSLNKWFGDLKKWDFEQILTILQSWELFNAIAKEKADTDNDEFLRTINRYLVWAAILSLKVNIGENKKKMIYDHFVKSLDDDDAIISLNYDTILEDAFSRNQRWFSMGISSDTSKSRLTDFYSPGKGIPILKIHGSSNLLKCDNEDCRELTSVDRKIAEELLAPEVVSDDKSPDCRTCEKGNLRPVIVPPGMNKSLFLQGIEEIWNRAIKELNSADKVIVIGCGLISADFDLEVLLKSTIGSKSDIPIEIVCKGLDPIMVFRCLTLFSQNKIIFYQEGFENWIQSIWRNRK